MLYSNCISASRNFPFSQSPAGWPVLQGLCDQTCADPTWGRALAEPGLVVCWQDLALCCLSVLPHEGSLHSRAARDLLLAQHCLKRHVPCLPHHPVCCTRQYGPIWCPAPCWTALAADPLCFLSLLGPKSPQGEKNNSVSWNVSGHF